MSDDNNKEPLSEYGDFKEHHRFAAQIVRDFIDMQLPGEVEIVFCSRNTPSAARDGNYDQIASIRIELDGQGEAVSYALEETDEIGGFSPGFVGNQLRIVKPTASDLDDAIQGDANDD